jgi:hypothetical protein
MATEGIYDDLGLGHTLRGFTAGQKLFNRYTLVRLLGRGGMGVVWSAQDEQLEEQVALKFLPETVTNDPEAIADLKHETKRSRELNHHYIVRIHDFVQDELAAGISMEYVDGRTMTELKLKQPARCFNARDLFGLVAQLCEALEYAHSVAKVVHRDLKPSNLMINSKRQLKVADFGIARSIADTASRLSGKLGTSGTPPYMSPQQANGEKASPADDIYALGATLYELLTGKPPFYSGDILDQLKHKEPPSIAERRQELGIEGEEVPVHWEETIAACLAKDPVQRPQSAAEVARRLLVGARFEKGASLVHLDGPGEASPKMHRLRRWPRKRVLVGIFVGAGMTLVLGAGVWHFHKVAATQIRGLKSESLGLGQHWTNSLGMPFVPVPGTKVLFCIWKTRVQDFEAFANAQKDSAMGGLVSAGGQGAWKTNSWFEQTPTRPVVYVSWDDANDFCKWLTATEQREKRIPVNMRYRLPTDTEWSWAVGIGEREGLGTPASKRGMVQGMYPWGTQWPPPRGTGNYAALLDIDDFPYTSPVGSFPANRLGLYDLGGNAWEWCEDWYDNRTQGRVLRGESFVDAGSSHLLSSERASQPANARHGMISFRCALAMYRSDKRTAEEEH